MAERKYNFAYNFRYNSDLRNYCTTRLYRGRFFDAREKQSIMFMLHIENNNDIGAFHRLTNAYCLAPVGSGYSYERVLKRLNLHLPVIYTSIGGCSVVGRLSVGNKYGLLLPNTTTELEFEHIKSQIPNDVEIRRVEEKLSALGNVIACNDKIAIIHPDLDTETEEIIKDTLNVEVYRRPIGKNDLVGSYCTLNNFGGFVHSKTQPQELEELSELLQIPVAAGTVARGRDCIGAGLAVNDNCGFLGLNTQPHEIVVMEKVFGFS